MLLTSKIAFVALLLTGLGLALRNYLIYLRTARRVHDLADALSASFAHEAGRDLLKWRAGAYAHEMSLHRTAWGGVERLTLALQNGQERPVCRLVARASKADQPTVGPHALGHSRFDAQGRVIGITNPGVRDRLLDGSRADTVVRLFKQGFDEIELNGKSVIASRQRSFNAEVLNAEQVNEWVKWLAEL